MSRGESIKEILICALIPYFLEKGDLWFQQHHNQIKKAALVQPFFQHHTCIIQKDQVFRFSEFLRKLDELGYEKVITVTEPGEFSRRGGIVDVFPINLSFAVRIEFYGNTIENIQCLPIETSDPEGARKRLLKRIKRHETFSGISKLKPGDYVVHLDHGVAKFNGIVKLTNLASSMNGDSSKYYVLEYAKGDKLYVPEGLERKLSLYVGFTQPTISRLSSPTWGNIKRKVKEETDKLAQELLNLYAQREITERPPYEWDEEFIRQVASTFPFKETPDQIQAIREIEEDLKKTRPMDRLVVGDVGFGKTEVALRAALYVATAGKQVVFMAPTTILSHQHFQTFKERLKNTPINIAHLSRLQSKKEQKEIINKIKGGEIDIIIGTHRIL